MQSIRKRYCCSRYKNLNIQTTIYRKETARQRFPRSNSDHLLSLKQSIRYSQALTLFKMGLFGAAHGWGVGGGGEAKSSPSLKSSTHILQWWNLAQLYLNLKCFKKFMNHVAHPLSSADSCIYSTEISKLHYIKKYRYRMNFDT